MLLDLTGSRDRNGFWEIRHYNGNRQMDSFSDRRGLVTKYHWCACGSLESIEDPRQQVTRFFYDIQGRPHQKVFADDTVINYLYEGQTAPHTTGATSRLRSMTDAEGQTTSYEYFADNNLKRVTYTNAVVPTSSVAFTYDDYYARISMMEDGSGITRYAYYPVTMTPTTSGAGRLMSVDGPLPSDTIVYTYNDAIREVSESINGATSTMRYDTLGRLARSINLLGTFNRTYDPITRRLQTIAHDNGKTTNYSYFDNNGDLRLKTLNNLSSSGANLSTFDYTYGEDFRVAIDGVRARDVTDDIFTWSKQLGMLPAVTGTYTYDAGRRLTRATTGTVGVAPGNYNYDYDFGGNRTLDEVAPGTHSFNSVNQTQDPGYTYDLNGNLTSDGTSTFTWDAANRLVSIQKDLIFPRTRSEFSYDGLGRRVRVVEKQASSVDGGGNPVWTTLNDYRYIWNGNTLAEERDGTSAMMATKRFYREGEQIYGVNYYYTHDHLGSIREMTDATGALRAQYEYDPYGNRTKLSGDVDTDFGFTGHYHHGPSGLNLALFRAYSPKLGRWLSRDPLENAELTQGPNLYSYVHNNPVNRIDPLGLFPHLEDMIDLVSGAVRSRSLWLDDVAADLESRHGSHSKHGGALSHCIFHCLFHRGAGPVASSVAVTAHNWAFENRHNPIPLLRDSADETSPGDREANRRGQKCARGRGSCVQECLKSYP
jgi:RHS repeat-associated protein